MKQLKQTVWNALHTIKTARPTLQKMTSSIVADFLVSGTNAVFWIFVARLIMFTGLSETTSMIIGLSFFFIVQLCLDDVKRL